MSEKNYEYKKIHPFKWFVLQNFPFIEEDFDALTNYQLFCKLGEEIDKVIKSTNDIGLQVESLTDYVSNYFENLDVQDEINNKLDEMAENGELEEIIGAYLETKAIFGFNNVSEMKSAENLINGSYVKTLGFHSINDGGSAVYKIRTLTNNDVIDESFIIALDDETLVAELIIEDGLLYANKLGADNTGTTDASTIINNALAKINNYWIEGKRINTLVFEGVYKIDSQIKMPPCAKLKGNGFVKFISNVANDSTILIDYLNDTLPSNVEPKQRYLSGELINFEQGSIIVYNGNNTTDNSIAIEIGSRISETTDYDICRYMIRNISIYNFSIGLLHNVYNVFIANYDHLHLENNIVNVQFGRIEQRQATTNAGEKISFENCTIASSSIAFNFESINWSIYLNNCSIDFNTSVFKQYDSNLYWNNIQVNQCHIETYEHLIENFNKSENYININNSLLYDTNNITNPITSSNNCPVIIRDTEFEHRLDDDEIDPEKLIITGTPDLFRLDNTRTLVYNRKDMAVLKNNLIAPLFDAITDGDVNIAYNQIVNNWKVTNISNINTTAQVVTDNYLYTGHKSLVFSLTNTATTGQLALQSNFYIPVTNEKLIQNTFYMFNIIGRQCRALITWYDANKVEISTKTSYEYLPTHDANKWVANVVPNFDFVPANAKFYKITLHIIGIEYDNNYSNSYKIGGIISNSR